MSSFYAAFEQFVTSGDFLTLTRQFELAIPAVEKFRLKNANATLLDTGVLLIEPDEMDSEPKDIIISSGIHGNETAPIEIVNNLLTNIIQGNAQVKHRTLFIIGNPVAMNIGQRFQIENLNRLFSGKYKSIAPCYERQRAEHLEQYVIDFFTSEYSQKSTKYHFDLHTAIRNSKYEKFAIYPFQGDKPWDKNQLAFLQYCGVDTILFGHAPSGTFSYLSSAIFQAHAFTIELGKVKPFGENDMDNFKAMQENLAKLIQAQDIAIPEFNNKNVNLFTVLGEITKETDDFKLFIADDVSNFTDFPINTVLSQDGETQYITTHLGESIVFPNAKVTNGQRAGLLVVPTQL